MKIISCKQCGVMMDADVVAWPDPDAFEDLSSTGDFIWDGDRFIAVSPCPVCKYDLIEPE